MRHLGLAKMVSSLFLLGILFITACGRQAYNPYANFSRQTINNPIQGPSISTGGNSSTGGATQSAYALGSFSGITPTVGSNVSLILFDRNQSSGVSGATPIAANFSIEGNPAGVQFVGSAQGVTQVQITSSQAVNVTVKAIPVALANQSNPPSALLTLTFMASPAPSTFTCEIRGPFPFRLVNNPLANPAVRSNVGEYTYFRVTSARYYGSLEILEAGTYDRTEQANFANNYTKDELVIWFTNAGSKTLFVKARANDGSICNTQINFRVESAYVAPQPGTCGLYQTPYSNSDYQCFGMGSIATYYVSNGQCVVQPVSVCSAGGQLRGAFDTLQACQAALTSGSCGYYTPPRPQAQWCPVTNRLVGVSSKYFSGNNLNRFEQRTLADGIVLPSDAHGISMVMTSVTVDDWSPEIKINGVLAYQQNDTNRPQPRTIVTNQSIGYLLRGGSNAIFVKSYNKHTYWSTYFSVSGGYFTYGSCSDSFSLVSN